MAKYIEEDMRYITGMEFSSYTQEQRETRPALPGYDFSLLLDQMDGYVLSHPTHSPVFSIFCTCGTAYWLARHFEETNEVPDNWAIFTQQPKVQLKFYLDPSFSSRKVISDIKLNTCVVSVTEDLKAQEVTSDVLVICTAAALNSDYARSLHKTQSAIVYDPRRLLGGTYFLGSKIWIK